MEKGRKKFKNSNFHFVNIKRDFRNSEYDMEEEKELPPRGFFRTSTKNSFVVHRLIRQRQSL